MTRGLIPPPRPVHDDDRRGPSLVEIAARIAERVAAAQWRTGIPKATIAYEALDLAAMILNGRSREARHPKLDVPIGYVEIHEDGTFWGLTEAGVDHATGAIGRSIGPFTTRSACIDELALCFEGRA